MRNKEGYLDPTAGEAIREADQQPDRSGWYLQTIRDLADIVDLEIVEPVQIRVKKTRRVWRSATDRNAPVTHREAVSREFTA